jgi:hypothetical protein
VFTALRATSLTIAELLRQHFMAAPALRLFFDSALGGTMVISLKSPQGMAQNNEQGVSLWLYRVSKDGERPNEPMERIGRTKLRRRPLPVNLQYLITPIVPAKNSNSTETEQGILGKVLQILHDHPRLGGAQLRDDFIGTRTELNICMESISIDDTARIFDALEQSYRLSLSYQVGVVMIDSDHEPLDTSIVETAIPEIGLEVGS